MKSILVTGIISLMFMSSTNHAQTTVPVANNTKKTLKMKEFILLVRVPITYTGEQAKAVNPTWDMVLAKWKADNIFVTSFVFPGESYVISGTGRSLKKEVVVSDNLKVVSNIILRAENLEDAVELAKACPVLDHGGSIEVREVPAR